MVERRQRHAGADAQPRGARRRQGAHHVHRRAHAEIAEMVLGEPHRVVAGTIHDLDAFDRAREHGREVAAPPRPAEELQDTEFTCASYALSLRAAEGGAAISCRARTPVEIASSPRYSQ